MLKYKQTLLQINLQEKTSKIPIRRVVREGDNISSKNVHNGLRKYTVNWRDSCIKI